MHKRFGSEYSSDSEMPCTSVSGETDTHYPATLNCAVLPFTVCHGSGEEKQELLYASQALDSTDTLS